MLTRKAMLSSPRLTVFVTSHKLQVMMSMIGSIVMIMIMIVIILMIILIVCIDMMLSNTNKIPDELEVRCGDWDVTGEEFANEVFKNKIHQI